MCNAWNHHPSCTCGWGREGHSGLRTTENDLFRRQFYWVPEIRKDYESFVNPNASCPACGESVFFYQSPSGGRVFFDELGPPWPKHPCTDNKSSPRKLSNHERTISAEKEYKWQKEGWNPFYIDVVGRLNKYVVSLRGLSNSEEVILYINLPLLRHGSPMEISSDSVAHLSEIEKGKKYRISYLSIYGFKKEHYAYRSTIDARNE